MSIRVSVGKTIFPSLIGCMALGGCANFPHVEVSAPNADAPLEERLEAYQRLSTTSTSAPMVVRVDPSHPAQITLSDGTQVYWSEDLLPVVSEDSPTAKAAQKANRIRTTAKTIGIISSIATLVGGAMLFGPVLASVISDREPSKGATGVALTGGFLSAGGIGVSITGQVKANTAARENAWAFGTYNLDLRRRLGICRTKSGDMVDCAPGTARESSP